MNPISSIHNEIEKIVQSIVGDISKHRLKDFIRQSWDKGKILFHADECYHSSIELIPRRSSNGCLSRGSEIGCQQCSSQDSNRGRRHARRRARRGADRAAVVVLQKLVGVW